MTHVSRIARWAAIAIAAAAVLDPSIPLSSRERPAIRIVGNPNADEGKLLAAELTRAGFTLDSGAEAATLVVGNRVPDALRREQRTAAATALPIWALDTSARPPNVRIVSRTVSPIRFPGQTLELRIALEGQGVAGKTSEVTLEDGGIPVASAKHVWSGETSRWDAVVHYLPPGARAGRLRAIAGGVAGETTLEDNVADVGVPPMRGPLRVLVVEAAVTWPAMFVRRAIEGEPAFAVAAMQRMSPQIVTRAGAPPVRLTRDALTPFEVALIGAPDTLTTADIEALRWFVEERGGVAVIIPDARPRGRYVDLLGAPALEPRVIEAAAPLVTTAAASLMASELLIVPRLPFGARVLAATAANEPVVFAARHGAGGIIFSGALDAWRYRARDDEAFARFWRHAIAEEAATVPPELEVTADALVRAGSPVQVRVRLRATELPAAASISLDPITARAVAAGAANDRVDIPFRLWPAVEPGVFEGEWVPPVAGDYNVTVTAGSRTGDAPVTAVTSLTQVTVADPAGLALAARVSGGQVFAADRAAALADALSRAFPATPVMRRVKPMRSLWWVVAFAALLSVEWAIRRTRGLA